MGDEVSEVCGREVYRSGTRDVVGTCSKSSGHKSPCAVAPSDRCNGLYWNGNPFGRKCDLLNGCGKVGCPTNGRRGTSALDITRATIAAIRLAEAGGKLGDQYDYERIASLLDAEVRGKYNLPPALSGRGRPVVSRGRDADHVLVEAFGYHMEVCYRKPAPMQIPEALTRRVRIEATLSDLVSKLLYYDRKGGSGSPDRRDRGGGQGRRDLRRRHDQMLRRRAEEGPRVSYDYPDDYVPPPPKKMTVRDRISGRWWTFVLWCALDCRSEIVNTWGLNRLQRADLRRLKK